MSQQAVQATPAKRRTTDVARLMASEHHVIVPDSANTADFYVKLRGPADRYELRKTHLFLYPAVPVPSVSCVCPWMAWNLWV
jgi:hypothetical protein